MHHKLLVVFDTLHVLVYLVLHELVVQLIQIALVRLGLLHQLLYKHSLVDRLVRNHLPSRLESALWLLATLLIRWLLQNDVLVLTS